MVENFLHSTSCLNSYVPFYNIKSKRNYDTIVKLIKVPFPSLANCWIILKIFYNWYLIMYTHTIITLIGGIVAGSNQILRYWGTRFCKKVKSGRRAVRTGASTITGSVDLVWQMRLERLRNITCEPIDQVSRKTRPVVT